MKTLRLPMLAALAGFIASCGNDERVAGGGGFGGETLTGMVVSQNGDPIPGAQVDLRPSRSYANATFATARTDGSGNFAFDRIPAFPVRLEVTGRRGADTLRAMVDIEPGARSLGTIAAKASPVRRVRLVSPTGTPIDATVFAYGLGRSATTDDSGYLRLEGWPPADIWVRVLPRRGSDTSDLLIPHVPSGDVVLDRGWLVDDFESTTIRTRLGLLVGGGWWYAVAVGQDSARYISPAMRDITTLRDTNISHGGRGSLHARFALRPDSVWGYGLVGFHFGATRNLSVDLAGVDSLVFWTRGSGTVRAEIVAVDGQDTAHYARSFAPGAEWKRVTLRKADLVPVEAGASPWNAAAGRALFFQFIVFESADFWIDELRLHGTRLPG